MEKYEFSVVFRHATRTDKDVKVKLEGDDVRKICEEAVAWFGQRLRAKIQYQWQLPSSQAVMTGITASAAGADGSALISNMIDGIIIKVRHVAKPVARTKSAATTAA